MKILLTGNLGYVGSVVSPYLRTRGHEVLGLDIGYYRDGLLAPADDAPTLIRDVRDYDGAELAGIDGVVHLAALSNDPTGDLDATLTDDINHKASVRLAELARKAGVRRFVFASSCSLYGVAGEAPVDENAAFNPQTAYARSKVDAERGLQALASDSFSPVSLRFSTAYGLSPRLRLDIVANNLTGWATVSSKIKLMSDGSPWRPLIHVADMANAICAALEAPRDTVHNEAFNVGRDSDNYQVRDIALAVKEAVPGSEVEFAAGAAPDNRTYRVSFAKVRRGLPSFRPTRSLREGVGELYEAYRKFGLTTDRFNGPEFVRLRQLNRLVADKQLDAELRWQPRHAVTR